MDSVLFSPRFNFQIDSWLELQLKVRCSTFSHQSNAFSLKLSAEIIARMQYGKCSHLKKTASFLWTRITIFRKKNNRNILVSMACLWNVILNWKLLWLLFYTSCSSCVIYCNSQTFFMFVARRLVYNNLPHRW